MSKTDKVSFFPEDGIWIIVAQTLYQQSGFTTAKSIRFGFNDIQTPLHVKFIDKKLYVYRSYRDRPDEYLTYDDILEMYGNKMYKQIPYNIEFDNASGYVTLLTADNYAIKQSHSNPPRLVESKFTNGPFDPFQGLSEEATLEALYIAHACNVASHLLGKANNHYNRYQVGEFIFNLGQLDSYVVVSTPRIREWFQDEKYLLGNKLTKLIYDESNAFVTTAGNFLLTEKQVTEMLLGSGDKRKISLVDVFRILFAKSRDIELVILDNAVIGTYSIELMDSLTAEQKSNIKLITLSMLAQESKPFKQGYVKVTDAILHQIDIPLLEVFN